MERQQTRQTTQRPAETDADSAAAPGGSNLVDQARGYANTARRARENCQRGHAAERELRNRRNRSGQ